MSVPYVGQIQLFAFGFAPKGYTLCQGQLLDIRQNATLFKILGTLYGGDGRSTFGLPDLRGRIPFQFSDRYREGVTGGTESHTLTVDQIPRHNHNIVTDASPRSGTSPEPDPTRVLGVASGVLNPPGSFDVTLYNSARPTGTLDPNAIAPSGASRPHNNLMPYLVMNYSIALTGLTPDQ